MNSLPGHWFAIGLLALIIVAGLTMGIGLAGAPFWVDEAISATIAERSIDDIFRLLANTDANMGLYYLLLHFWLWGGDSEAWIRAFSALAALAAVPATAILARRLFGDSVGLVAGFLMVGSMFVVQHAQNARAYALALLLITLATLFFVEAVRSRRPAHFVAYGATSVLAVYASPLTGLVLVAHVASLPLLPRRRELIQPFALTYGAALIAIAPLAAVLSMTGTEQLEWIDRPGLAAVGETGRELLGGGNRPEASNTPLVIGYGALLLGGLVALWVSGANGGQDLRMLRWRRSLVVGWLLIPPALLFAISQVQPLFVGRYLITSAPALATIAAFGLVTLGQRSRALAALAITVMIGASLVARAGLDAYGGGWAYTDRAAARMIVGESREGDGLVYNPRWTEVRLAWHLENETKPGASPPTDFATAVEAAELGAFTGRPVPADAFRSRLRPYSRVWLVGVADPSSAEVDPGLPALRSRYRLVRSQDFGGLRVELYERRSPGARRT